METPGNPPWLSGNDVRHSSQLLEEYFPGQFTHYQKRVVARLLEAVGRRDLETYETISNEISQRGLTGPSGAADSVATTVYLREIAPHIQAIWHREMTSALDNAPSLADPSATLELGAVGGVAASTEPTPSRDLGLPPPHPDLRRTRANTADPQACTGPPVTGGPNSPPRPTRTVSQRSTPASTNRLLPRRQALQSPPPEYSLQPPPTTSALPPPSYQETRDPAVAASRAQLQGLPGLPDYATFDPLRASTNQQMRTTMRQPLPQDESQFQTVNTSWDGRSITVQQTNREDPPLIRPLDWSDAEQLAHSTGNVRLAQYHAADWQQMVPQHAQNTRSVLENNRNSYPDRSNRPAADPRHDLNGPEEDGEGTYAYQRYRASRHEATPHSSRFRHRMRAYTRAENMDLNRRRDNRYDTRDIRYQRQRDVSPPPLSVTRHTRRNRSSDSRQSFRQSSLSSERTHRYRSSGRTRNERLGTRTRTPRSHHSRDRRRSSTSSTDSTSSSSSDSFESDHRRRHRRHRHRRQHHSPLSSPRGGYRHRYSGRRRHRTSSSDSSSSDDVLVGLSRHMPKMKAYDGHSDWPCFKYQFNALCRQERWTSKQKKKNLFYFLVDGALKYAIRNKNCSYKSLMKKLGSRYDKTLDSDTAQVLYQVIGQHVVEDLGAFYDRVMSRARDAFPESKFADLQKSMVTTYLKGLRDSWAGFSIKQYQKPKTIHDAYKLSKSFIASKASFATASRRHGTNSRGDRTMGELQVRIGQLLNNQTNSSNPITPPRRGRCFNCNEVGHYSPDCPAPRRPRSPSAGRGSPRGSPRAGCFNCGSSDHRMAECRQPLTCSACRKTGHWKNECPERICSRCQEKGHQPAGCPNPIRCAKCKRTGHASSQCTIVCPTCRSVGHEPRDCPLGPQTPRNIQPGGSINTSGSQRDLGTPRTPPGANSC